MINDFSNFKPINIEEILDIPKHWDLRRLATIGTFSKGRGISKADIIEEGELAILYGDIYTKYDIKARDLINHISEETSRNSITIKRGDILFTGSGETIEDIGKTIVYLGTKPAFAGGDVIVLRLKDCNSEFISYTQNSDIAQFQKSRDSNGDIIVHTYSSKLRNLIIGLPPISEQQKIATFLDHKVILIDKFIFNRKKQIELLEEEKAAIINKAVTNGIDPNVKQKPSGVLTVDEIPEYWVMTKIKFLKKQKKGAIKTGPFGSHLKSSDMREDGEIKVYNQKSVIENNFSDGDEYISLEKYKQLTDFTVEIDDLLITSRGTIGRSAIFLKGMEKGVLHPCLIRLQFDSKKVLKEYVKMCIDFGMFFIEDIQLLSNSTVIDVIYSYNLKEVFIPTPPTIEEQNEILIYIEIEASKIELLVKKYQSQIDLIEEYKTSLISKAVTGKIDVRDWQLPKKENR